MTASSELDVTITKSLDARRLLCPMPVIRTQKAIKDLAAGDILEVLCTDPGSMHDIPAWCRIYGHEVLMVDEQGDEIIFHIRVIATETEAENDGTEEETW